ncbi:hypothetical protein ABMA32_00070 [Mesorhizobium sp. VNQ89]|uniref:hypothetical protein n=1 Tax=Mesorhizobium quangtriensis TaxID=3157709 RepID=UPI0032B87CF1
MAIKEAQADWLVTQLIERCKEGSVVDQDDLSIILVLNGAAGVPPEAQIFGLDYGRVMQDLGRLVAAKGELTVPNLQDYAQTEVLVAPPDWLVQWRNHETVPDAPALWAQFDMFTARAPDGGPLVMDGPGGHSFENWQSYRAEQSRILEKRRLRRAATKK